MVIKKLGMVSRKLRLVLIDSVIFLAIATVCMALNSQPDIDTRSKLLGGLLMYLFVFLSRTGFKVYRIVWRYAGTAEYLRVSCADFVGGALYALLSRLAFPMIESAAFLPKNVLFWQVVTILALNCIATLLTRNIYQLRYQREQEKERVSDDAPKRGEGGVVRVSEAEHHNKINVAIVGAGSVGALLARELMLNRNAHYYPYCFIDIDKQKVGMTISGVRVYDSEGAIERLKSMPVQEIIIALPDLPGEEKQRLFNDYKESGCKVKLYDFHYADGVGKRTMRELRIEDLLFRHAVAFDLKGVTASYRDKVILITGGGGSIGSELCRQIARLKPRKLVVFDIYENNAYDIEQELRLAYGDKINLVVEIGSVRDKKRLEAVFAMHRPEVVFHAAAHKHVPLMEHSCCEAVKNNVFGTLNAVDCAEKYGVKRFLLVSTDKAVNPTNVMGASKRLCEMIVQSKKDSKTAFVAVRFGNVLGSNGSVIQLFTRQLKQGGPLTLTDKRIIRYFMTIPEAAQLLLQACAMAARGEIYVLDMGEPVRILDLAENVIKLSGMRPYIDIDIKEIGLRPGEKLYEELLIKTEELDKTDNELIFIERDHALTGEELREKLALLSEALESDDQRDIVRALHDAVPTYHNADEVNRDAIHADEMQRAMNGKKTRESVAG